MLFGLVLSLLNTADVFYALIHYDLPNTEIAKKDCALYGFSFNFSHRFNGIWLEDSLPPKMIQVHHSIHDTADFFMIVFVPQSSNFRTKVKKSNTSHDNDNLQTLHII